MVKFRKIDAINEDVGKILKKISFRISIFERLYNMNLLCTKRRIITDELLNYNVLNFQIFMNTLNKILKDAERKGKF
jgi:hypothetical protein